MGFDGASEGDIQALEVRLGIRLPPTYRQFLAVSDGWRTLGINEPGLNPTSRVEWFREHHLDVIEAWQAGGRRPSKKKVPPISDEQYFVYGSGQATYNMRSEYLHSTLWISDGTDEGDYLLNPEVIFPDGEWEAWHFAHWYPGCRAYAILPRDDGRLPLDIPAGARLMRAFPGLQPSWTRELERKSMEMPALGAV